MLEESLDKDTSDGTDLSGITIKFVLAADLGESASVVELQATNVITQVTEAVGAFVPMLQTVGFTTSAVNMTTHVMTEVQTFVHMWNILLARMELLNKIIADIAQVSDIPSLD